MNNALTRLTLFTLSLLCSMVAMAQDAAPATDVMSSNGKIYVVMAVVLTILVGLFTYVASLDRKISRLEKK